MPRDDQPTCGAKTGRDPLYDSGRSIAKDYITFYGEHEMTEAFKNLSAIIHVRPTKEARAIYRTIDQKDLKKAWSGFYEFFAENGILDKNITTHRNQASLKFHSDWVLATARADGQD